MGTELQAAQLQVKITTERASEELDAGAKAQDELEKELAGRKERARKAKEEGPGPDGQKDGGDDDLADGRKGDRRTRPGTSTPGPGSAGPRTDGNGQTSGGSPLLNWRATTPFNLGQQVENLVAGIAANAPMGEAAVRAAVISEKYGPAVAAGIRETVPPAARPAFDVALDVARTFTATMSKGRAKLSAIDDAAGGVAEEAFARAKLGMDIDPKTMLQDYRARFRVAETIARASMARDNLKKELLGAGIGREVSHDVIDALIHGGTR